MLLNKLQMKNFKRFRDQEITFRDGITGIVGNNGTGKSSIVSAILFALYGVQGTGLDGNYLVSSFADQQEACEVRLDFSVGGNEYAVVRKFRRRSSSTMHEANLFLNQKLLANSVLRVAQEVQRIVGMGPGDLRNTIYAGQKELLTLLESRAGSRKDWFMQVLGIDYLKKDSLEDLKRLIDAREGTYREVHGRLQELDAEGIEARLAALDGKLQDAGDEICRIDALGQEADLRWEAARSERDRQIEVRDRYLHLVKDLEVLSSEVEHLGEECREAEGEIAAREALRADLERLKVLAERCEPLKAELSEMSERKSRADLLSQEAAACTGQIREYEERCSGLEEERAEIEEIERTCADLAPKVEAWREIQHRLLGLKQLLPEYERLRDEFSRLDERFAQIERRVVENRQEIEDLEGKARRLADLDEENKEYDELLDREERFARAAEFSRQEERCLREIRTGTDQLSVLEGEIVHLSRQLSAMGEIEEEIVSLESRKEYLTSRISVCTARQQALREEIRRVAEHQAEIIEAGPEGSCPLCHQGLGEHYQDLVGDLASAAGSLQDTLTALEGEHARAFADQQRLAGELEDLLGRRRVLQGLKEEHALYTSRYEQAALQVRRWQEEAQEYLAQIRALGVERYDPAAHESLKECLRRLVEKRAASDTLRGECARLPALQKERQRLIGDVEAYLARRDELEEALVALGFDPLEMKRLEAEERSLADVYRAYAGMEARLSRKPILEAEIESLAEKSRTLRERLNVLVNEHRVLAFDPERFAEIAEELGRAEEAGRTALELRIRTEEVPRMRQVLRAKQEQLAGRQRERHQVQESIDQLRFDANALVKAERLLAECEEDIQAIREQRYEAMGRRDALKAELEDYIRRRSRVNDLKVQQEMAHEEIERLKLTRSIIRDYTEYLLQVVRERIEEEAGRVLAEITDGRYGTVMLDDDFNIQVHDMGDDYPAERFSGGEQDDIAIALRIALSRFIAEVNEMHDSTFLIFDEIFGSQDEERRNNLIRALRTQEAHFPQIFLISHINEVHDEFSTTLVVEMGADRASKVREVA